MAIEWCKKCNAMILFPERGHVCQPIFEVWCPGEGLPEDCAEEIHSGSHDIAAEKWASSYDDDDPSIVNGTPVIVFVREKGSEDVKRFKVSGEYSREYHADEVESEEKE